MNSPDVTFVVPCLNEEANVAETIQAIVSAADGVVYEILVMDDGSVDRTSEVVQGIASEHPEYNLRLLRNPINLGLGASYFKGAHHARGVYYLLVMGDNVSPSESIRTVLKIRHEADMVIPFIAEPDRRPWHRRFLSKAFAWIVRIFSGHKVRYFNGSSNLQLTENVRRFQSNASGFAYQADLICRLLDEGKSFVEISVDYAVRTGGSTSAFRLKNIVSIGLTLFQLLRRRMLRTGRTSLDKSADPKASSIPNPQLD